MARQYLSLGVDLVEHAERVAERFETYGFDVKAEPERESGQPHTPTLIAKRAGRVTQIIDVSSRVDLRRTGELVAWAKTRDRDTRVSVAVPHGARVRPDEIVTLRSIGAGLIISGSAGVVETVAPIDQAVNLSLPALATMPKWMRVLMGPVYEQADRGQWREAFGDACTVLETEARRYLKSGMSSGRILLVNPSGKLSKLTSKSVAKLTLGNLADQFSRIQNKNYADSVIGRALATINRERVDEAHKKSAASTEARLRKKAAKHIWTIVEAVKLAR